LRDELAGIAEEQAVVAGRIDQFGGEQAGAERAERPADAVDADDVQRVVDAEALLDDVDGEVGSPPARSRSRPPA
jgi:hypothetical protein